MKKPYLELRTRNSFGDIINTYFLWLKYNFKPYTNLYLRYNAVSIILTLIGSYLLVTGFMGLASRDFRFGMGSNIDNELYLYGGLFMLIIILGLTAILNYSVSSAYIIEYVKNEGDVEPKKVGNAIKQRIGAVIIFVIIGAFIYVGYIIVSVILAFIPLLGMLAQYAISFTLTAFFGLAFTSLFKGKNTVTEALNEGWSFTFSNFLRVVFYGLIIGILNLMITFLIVSIPTFILGIYTYFSVESSIDITTSVFATIIYTIGFALFILSFVFTQALSQIAFGILYFNLHEEKYNIFLRERIEQIGIND
ncbi:hypothetical protein [Hanstruepera flava]|uniref:hypothetical protein n=1 Tax=Hanstruepera flava TaxID=2930218 RepID=UPI0020282598|nr:hypothetical protein [Hanstruepera flava]